MPEFEPLRTGQLVVRRRASRRRSTLLGIAAVAGIAALYGMYELGRFNAGYDHYTALSQRTELDRRREALEQENTRLRGELAAANTAREVDRQAYANVESSLGELQAQVLRQTEELTFYRGIVAPADGIGGLRIQSLNVLPAGADGSYRLRLVLVQAMRQDAVVSGSVQVALEGTTGEVPTRISLTDAETGAATALPFSFRYFQNLEREFVLPQGFTPILVQVEVRAPRQPPLQQSFAWQVDGQG